MGHGQNQPGGWVYDILPNLDASQLYDYRTGYRQGDTMPSSSDALAKMASTPLATLMCPSRHPRPVASVYSGGQFSNTSQVSVVGRSDYAGCAGSANADPNPTLDSMGHVQTMSGVGEEGGGTTPGFCQNAKYKNCNGVIYQCSQVASAQIRGGSAQTYLVGERWINSDSHSGGGPGDTHCMYVGHSQDTDRYTDISSGLLPQRDTAVSTSGADYGWTFGSAHPDGFNMTFCDGHLAYISYTIDPFTHMRAGDRGGKVRQGDDPTQGVFDETKLGGM